jgi:hypothetical protein
LGKRIIEEAQSLALSWLSLSGDPLRQAEVSILSLNFAEEEFARGTWEYAQRVEPLLLEALPEWGQRDYAYFIERAERAVDAGTAPVTEWLAQPYYRLATILFVAMKELGAQNKKELTSLLRKAEHPLDALKDRAALRYAANHRARTHAWSDGSDG